jgi:lactoylglutathione lyase
MRLNHLNLAVPNVPQAREFFETYFGFRCIAAPGRDVLAVLMDESGFLLNLSNFDKATEVKYPGAFHIGFMQESRERVDEIHARLKSDGFDVKPPRDYHGAWTFYFRAPGGFVVEIMHQYRMNLT